MIPFQWLESAALRNVRIYQDRPEWEWQSSARPHYNLWIALEGEGIFRRGSSTISFRPGSGFLIGPDEAVEAASTGRAPVVNFTAHLVPDSAAAVPEDLLRPTPPAELSSTSWVAPLCRYLSEAFYLDPEGNRQCLLAGITLLLAALERSRGGRRPSAVDDRLLGIIERIRRNPAAHYSVDNLAGEAGLSAAQFTRRFRAFAGVTPGRFIIEERLSRAEALLRETESSIESIAARLGYRDVYFFSRQFRRFRGISPGRWRRLGE